MQTETHDMTPAALLVWYHNLRKREHTGITCFVWHKGGIRHGGIPSVTVKVTDDWNKAKQE